MRTALLYTAGGGCGGVLHYLVSRGGPAVSVRATEMMCLYKSVYLLTPVLPCEMGAQSRVSRPVHCKLRNATQHSHRSQQHDNGHPGRTAARLMFDLP